MGGVCVCKGEGRKGSMYMIFAVPLKAPTIISANQTEASRVLVIWEY